LNFKNIFTNRKQRSDRTTNTYSQRTAVIHIGKPHKPMHRPKLAKEYACPNARQNSKYFFLPFKKN
jgi:hypothetical protein